MGKRQAEAGRTASRKRRMLDPFEFAAAAAGEAFRKHVRKLTPNDPGVVFLIDKAALMSNDHAGAVFDDAETALAALQETASGLEGTMKQFLTTVANVVELPWVRRKEGAADIGQAFVVTPKGRENVEMTHARIFFEVGTK